MSDRPKRKGEPECECVLCRLRRAFQAPDVDLHESMRRGTFIRDLAAMQGVAICRAKDDTLGFRFLMEMPQGAAIIRHGYQVGAFIICHELIEPVIVSSDGLINSEDAGDWQRVPSVRSN